MNACGLLVDFSPRTACSGLSFEEWARRDPENGYPWLMASNYQPKGSLRRAELIERAMAAKQVRTAWGYAYGPLAKALGPSASPLDRSAIFAQALSLDSVQLMAPVSVIEHCREDELRKGNRRTQCEHLATYLADRSDSFLLKHFGRGIGRNLGWSKDRLDAFMQELDAAQAVAPRAQDMRGCGGLATMESFLADVANYGELGALRRRLQAAQAASAATR
jgi:hypothetical protein